VVSSTALTGPRFSLDGFCRAEIIRENGVIIFSCLNWAALPAHCPAA
jgi:hypothetical protein